MYIELTIILLIIFVIYIIKSDPSIKSIDSSDYTYKIENTGKRFNKYCLEIKTMAILKDNIENNITTTCKTWVTKKYYWNMPDKQEIDKQAEKIKRKILSAKI